MDDMNKMELLQFSYFSREEGKVIEIEVRRYFDEELTRYEDFTYKIRLEKQI